MRLKFVLPRHLRRFRAAFARIAGMYNSGKTEAGFVAFCKAHPEISDIHMARAMYVFDKQKSDITKEDRAFGKALNFGAQYGCDPAKMFECIPKSKESDSMTVAEAYLTLHRKAGFKVGDRVRLCRRAASYGLGWRESWDPAADQYVGQELIVLADAGMDGYVTYTSDGNTYNFPFYALDYVTKSAESVVVAIPDGFRAITAHERKYGHATDDTWYWNTDHRCWRQVPFAAGFVATDVYIVPKTWFRQLLGK